MEQWDLHETKACIAKNSIHIQFSNPLHFDLESLIRQNPYSFLSWIKFRLIPVLNPRKKFNDFKKEYIQIRTILASLGGIK